MEPSRSDAGAAAGASQQVDPAPAGPAAGGDADDGSQPRQQRYDDEFMMFTFKVEMCRRVDKHDRARCPYAHPGELARRRHPSLYQALLCPEARAKKICPRLENCNCSHSTFEFWLHPDRYKTFLCERGTACERPICFFAHTEGELRALPQGLQRTQPAPRPAGSSGGGHDGHPDELQGAATQLGDGQLQQYQHYEHHQQQQQQGGWVRQGSPAAAAGGAQRAGQHPSGGPMLPPHQRGRTVAVISAGPSTWQGNTLIEADPGEAPTLEALCAALARGALAPTVQLQPPPDQQQPGVPSAMLLQHLAAQQAAQLAMPPPAASMSYPVVQSVQLLSATPVPQHQQAGIVPMQPPQLLQGGQLVHLPPQAGPGGAQLHWNMQPPPGGM